MSNLVYLTVLIVTNWVTDPADFRHEGGTNYQHQRMTISTNQYIIEVKPCTNFVIFKMDQAPDPKVSRWIVAGPPPLPTAPANPPQFPTPLPTTASSPLVRKP